MNKWNVKGEGLAKPTCGKDKRDEGVTAVSLKWKLLKLRDRYNCDFSTLFSLTLFDKGTSLKALKHNILFGGGEGKKKQNHPQDRTPLLPC